jgi:hypothetical protein
MNAQNATNNDLDLFNRGTLELTFKILRRKHPLLALQVQNALVSVYPRNDYHTALTATELPLSAATITEIAQALLAVSEELLAAGKSQRNDLVIVRSLMLDWLMLAHECSRTAA